MGASVVILAALLAGLLAAAAPAAATPRIVGGSGVAATPRIVGGSGVSSIARFPFQVALYDPRAGSVTSGFFCGGVIIDATHVATAAHCLLEEESERVSPPSHIAVLAGSNRLGYFGQPLGGAGAVQDPALATSIDPAYDRATSDYDVAVVRLRRPLWSGAVSPAHDGLSAIAPIGVDATLAGVYTSLATLGEPVLATVSGWGDTVAEPSGGPGSYPNALQSVHVPLVSEATCASDYSDPFSSQPITARMLCAGGHAGGGDSCFGDSGGPLVVDRDNPPNPPQDYVLAGLVSFGDGCAQPESPGVYAKIADPEIASFLTSNPAQTPFGRFRSSARADEHASSPPSLTVIAKGCTHGRCTVVVAAAARRGAAVRTVRATLGFHARGSCRRRGKRVACVRLVSRTARVKATTGGRFLVVADHLRPGRCTFSLTAIDRSGLQQARPTRVRLLVS